MSDDRGRRIWKSEDGMRKSEKKSIGQGTEDRRHITDDRGQIIEVGRRSGEND